MVQRLDERLGSGISPFYVVPANTGSEFGIGCEIQSFRSVKEDPVSGLHGSNDLLKDRQSQESEMVAQVMKYVGHPLAAFIFGFVLILAVTGILFRYFQQRKRDQYITLRKDISRMIDDEMAGIRRDISIVIENELSKIKKNVSIGVRTELLKVKESIPALIKSEMKEYDGHKPTPLNDKIIPLNKTKHSQQVKGEYTFENDKEEALDVEKEIAKLNRNMSVVTALLVEMNHRTGKRKQHALNNTAVKRPYAEGSDL